MQKKTYYFHSFPGPKQTGPLRDRVLKAAVELGKFQILDNASTWTKIRHLADQRIVPSFNISDRYVTFRLFRSLVRKAARQGKFDLLYALYSEQPDHASRRKTFHLSLEDLAFRKIPRESLIRQLVEEIGDAPITYEACKERCIPEIYKYVSKPAFVAWHEKHRFEIREHLPPREAIAKLLIESGEYYINPGKARSLIARDYPEEYGAVRAETFKAVKDIKHRETLRGRLRKWIGRVILEHTDGSGKGDGWRYLWENGAVFPHADGFFSDDAVAGAALAMIAKSIGGVGKINPNFLDGCFMNSLVRRLIREGHKTSEQMKARIAELVAKNGQVQVHPAHKRPPRRQKKILPAPVAAGGFSDKPPLAEKAVKTIKEKVTPKRTQEKGQSLRTDFVRSGIIEIPLQKQTPKPAKSKVPKERVPRAEKEEKRTFMESLDFYAGSRLHFYSAAFQVGLANRCCLHIAKRLKPVSDSIYLLAKVKTPHGGSNYVSNAVKTNRKGVLVHLISIDLSGRKWQYTVSGRNEPFKPNELDSVLGRIMLKSRTGA